MTERSVTLTGGMLAGITDHLRHEIWKAILRERDYQDTKWGDKPHTVGEWLLIMEAELAEAKLAWAKGNGDEHALYDYLSLHACTADDYVAAAKELGIWIQYLRQIRKGEGV